MRLKAAAPQTGDINSYVAVDGTYIRVSARLRALVALLVDGCSEAALRREIDVLRPGQIYSKSEMGEMVNQLFAPHSLAIDEAARDSCDKWRLRSTITGRAVTGMESALRCRITIVPETLANYVAGSLKALYTPTGAALAALICALMSAGYIFRFGLASLAPDVLFKSVYQVSVLSVAVTILAILFSTLFHELGHCTAVAAFGLRVGRIGFGIYWLSPALFSDVSAAWTLTRKQRVAVDCGGIYFQVILCSLYALAAVVIHSEPMQLALRIAIAANIVAIVTSLNPIMKCDGYWILSDAMAIPNLRRQSERVMRDFVRGALGKAGRHTSRVNQARRFLLGYGVLSVVFSWLMLLLFGVVIYRNAAEAIYFPRELWDFFGGNSGLSNLGPACSRLALDFLRVVPVACAPIAFITATSALTGFLSRTFSGDD